MDTIITAIVCGVLGSGGVFGIFIHLFKCWIEKKIQVAELEVKQHRQNQHDRYVVADEYNHAIGRFVFWAQFGAKKLEEETGKTYWNGELQAAYEAVKEAELKKKELDRKQLASVNEE